MAKQSFMSQRVQMCLVGLGLWLLLAFWSVRAFTRHISEMGGADGFDYVGAAAGEFALLAFILWHCFNKHINVRRWSLIFAFTLGTVILVHSGALRGMREARTAQTKAVDALTDKLTEMSTEQARAIGDSTVKQVGRVESQRERLAIQRQTKQAQGEVAKAAQENVVKEVMAAEDKVKDNSILPRWYLDGWSYSVIFALASLFVTIIFFLMMSTEDIDANFDGVPDSQQLPQAQPQTASQRQAGTLYAYDQSGRLVEVVSDGKEGNRPSAREFPSLPHNASDLREDGRRGHLDVRSSGDGLDRSENTVQSGLDRSRPDSVKDLNLIRPSLNETEREGRELLLERLKLISFHNPGYSFKIVEGADNIKIRLFKSERQRQIQTAACFVDKARILADVVMMSEDAFCARLVRLLNKQGFNLQEVTR